MAGRPLISYPLAVLREAGLEAVVVAKQRSELPELSCAVHREPTAPTHPLCGIIAALRFGAGRPVVVVGCDMPLVPALLLAWLAGLHGLVVPQVDGRLEPLLARYEPSHLGALESAMRSELPMSEAIASLKPRIVGAAELERFGDPRRACFSVNDRVDLALAERWLARAG